MTERAKPGWFLRLAARLVLAGVSHSDIPNMPLALMRAIGEESARQKAAAEGGPDWDPDSIPDPENPDGPPPKNLFVAYGMALGWPAGKCEAEYERQLKAGGGWNTRDKTRWGE